MPLLLSRWVTVFRYNVLLRRRFASLCIIGVSLEPEDIAFCTDEFMSADDCSPFILEGGPST